MKWINIKIDKGEWHKVHSPSYSFTNAEWCMAHPSTGMFELESDAMLFMLRWGHAKSKPAMHVMDLDMMSMYPNSISASNITLKVLKNR